MNIGINTGSKIRTLLRIATSLNTALCMTMTAVQQIDNKILNVVWLVMSILLDGFVGYITTYYNNDYTEEGALGTGRTRQKKAEKKKGYVGERFYTKEDDDE